MKSTPQSEFRCQIDSRRQIQISQVSRVQSRLQNFSPFCLVSFGHRICELSACLELAFDFLLELAALMASRRFDRSFVEGLLHRNIFSPGDFQIPSRNKQNPSSNSLALSFLDAINFLQSQSISSGWRIIIVRHYRGAIGSFYWPRRQKSWRVELCKNRKFEPQNERNTSFNRSLLSHAHMAFSIRCGRPSGITTERNELFLSNFFRQANERANSQRRTNTFENFVRSILCLLFSSAVLTQWAPEVAT